MTAPTKYSDLCREKCAYGTCSDPGKYGGPYGCGGCCGCLGGCQVAYEETLPVAPAIPVPPTDDPWETATPLGDIADT